MVEKLVEASNVICAPCLTSTPPPLALFLASPVVVVRHLSHSLVRDAVRTRQHQGEGGGLRRKFPGKNGRAHRPGERPKCEFAYQLCGNSRVFFVSDSYRDVSLRACRCCCSCRCGCSCCCHLLPSFALCDRKEPCVGTSASGYPDNDNDNGRLSWGGASRGGCLSRGRCCSATVWLFAVVAVGAAAAADT